MMTSSEGNFQRYLFEYKFDNAEWAIEIVAADPAEARERLKAISWAQYKGEIFAKIPVTPGPLTRALSRIRSALSI
ncbi:hypothetical protein [Bradyrhizobium aeschynomenes]|nr:hypothetical protein [Bradyrhizobium aeschynomenes]